MHRGFCEGWASKTDILQCKFSVHAVTGLRWTFAEDPLGTEVMLLSVEGTGTTSNF